MLRHLLNTRAKLAGIALTLALAGCVDMGASRAPVTARVNNDLAQDFLDLTFQLETGQVLDRLLKYEGPVRVALDPALAAYRADLTDVLSRIKRGAGLDIAQGDASAQIHVVLVPAEQLRSAAPGAACFVAPGVQSWAEFRSNPRQRWSTLTALGRAAVFIPDDAAPYSVRACLNEEIGQALGPVNDLYNLPETVFNDDNIHLELTDYDLLILRILYARELRNGASRDVVAAALPGVIARINTSASVGVTGVRTPAPQGWQRALETALDARQSDRARESAARTSLNLIRQVSPPDHRLVLSLMISGRFAMRSDPVAARQLFAEAHTVSLAQLGNKNLRTAQTAYHLAATLIRDDPSRALELVAEYLPVAARANDAPLESGLLAIRAISYLRLGRMADADRARRASLERAAYAFGETADDQDPVLGFPTNGAPS